MKFHLPLPGRRLRRILTLLGQAALCCVLTAARLGGLYAPFSLAAAAAAGPGLPGLLSLLGVTGGALLFLDFQPGLRHAAAAVLLFAAQTAFCDTKFYRRPAFRPLTAALSQLLIQSVYLLYRPLSQWVLCLTASALLAAATALLTAHGTTLRQKGLLYAAALSLALVPVTVEGMFSVGKALLMAELLLLSRRLPPLTAGLAGACAGLAADLVPETPVLLLTVAIRMSGRGLCLTALSLSPRCSLRLRMASSLGTSETRSMVSISATALESFSMSVPDFVKTVISTEVGICLMGSASS